MNFCLLLRGAEEAPSGVFADQGCEGGARSDSVCEALVLCKLQPEQLHFYDLFYVVYYYVKFHLDKKNFLTSKVKDKQCHKLLIHKWFQKDSNMMHCQQKSKKAMIFFPNNKMSHS